MDFQGTHDLYRTELKELDTKGFGVATSRTGIVPLKGFVEDMQWSWSSVLSFLNTWTEPKVLKWLLGYTGIIIIIYMNVTTLLLLYLMSTLLARETLG